MALIFGVVLMVFSIGWAIMLWKEKVEATKGGLICSVLVVVFESVSLILSVLIGQFILREQWDNIIAVLLWGFLGALEVNKLKKQRKPV